MFTTGSPFGGISAELDPRMTEIRSANSGSTVYHKLPITPTGECVSHVYHWLPLWRDIGRIRPEDDRDSICEFRLNCLSQTADNPNGRVCLARLPPPPLYEEALSAELDPRMTEIRSANSGSTVHHKPPIIPTGECVSHVCHRPPCEGYRQN